jgi:hypothetical protein
MIDWDSPNVSVTVPPVLHNIPSEELIQKLTLNEAQIPEWPFIRYPCHTVAVERTVKLVTQATKVVCGAEARDMHIRATLLSRQVLPSYDYKGKFVSILDTEMED